MYLEGDIISKLKYSMLYLDYGMLFRIRYHIWTDIIYLVRTDVPNCLKKIGKKKAKDRELKQISNVTQGL